MKKTRRIGLTCGRCLKEWFVEDEAVKDDDLRKSYWCPYCGLFVTIAHPIAA